MRCSGPKCVRFFSSGIVSVRDEKPMCQPDRAFREIVATRSGSGGLLLSLALEAVMRKILMLCVAFVATLATAQQYDIVLEGGRVMDPETNLDAIRNVGISDGKIARISSDTLSGKRVIHVTGLVVAPGFIDLHQHGQDVASQRVKAFDGVTTALEMEIGVPDVTRFLKSKEGHSLIHFGTTASHVAARSLIFGTPLPEGTILPKSGPATDQPASPEQIDRIE